MTWYKKIILSQTPPIWTGRWHSYLSKNIEILVSRSPVEGDPYLITSPKYDSVYEGLVVDFGAGEDKYKVIFVRKGDNLVSTIVLNNTETMFSKTFDMMTEKPYNIVVEIVEKIKQYSERTSGELV